MPLTFQIISIANITDPAGAFNPGPLGFSTEVDNGAATTADSVSFASIGDVRVDIAQDRLGDDNGATLSNPITVNGTPYAAGSSIETDYGFVVYDAVADLYFMASHVSINNDYVGAVLSRGFDFGAGAYGDLYTPGNSLSLIDPNEIDDIRQSWISFIQNEEFNNGPNGLYDNDIDVFDNGSAVTCFTRGTRIRRADGCDVPVEALKVGDTVQTLDGPPKPIRWIGRRQFSRAALDRCPNLRPVRIRKDALATGLPARDLLVSRQHRMLLASAIAERMFGEPEVLVAACRLVGLPGIAVAEDLQDVEYFHLLFDDHQVVLAEGAPSESLHPGAQALNSMTEAARAEILQIFPELAAASGSRDFARVVPIGRRQKKLIARHRKSGKRLLQGATLSPQGGQNSTRLA